MRNKRKGRINGLGGGGGGGRFGPFHSSIFEIALHFQLLWSQSRCEVVQALLKVTIQVKMLHVLEFTVFLLVGDWHEHYVVNLG